MTDPAAILVKLLRTGQAVAPGVRWPRVRLGYRAWQRMYDAISLGELELVALWGEPESVHVAVRHETDGAIFTYACPRGTYPSLGQRHPPAIRLERALRDLVDLYCPKTYDHGAKP